MIDEAMQPTSVDPDETERQVPGCSAREWTDTSSLGIDEDDCPNRDSWPCKVANEIS